MLVGSGLTYLIIQVILKNRSQKIIKEAKAEGEVIKKDKILQAKEKFLQLKSEHEKLITEKNSKIIQAENKIQQKEIALSQKIEENQREKQELDAIRENLKAQMEILEKKEDELTKLHRQRVENLEAVSGLSAEEAKQSLIDSLKEEAKTEAEDSKYITIKSPIIGTFYRKPSPDKPPFVEVGDSITQGDVLCVIEAMKLFNDIESEVSGKIVKVLVEDSSPVEFDQPLFLIDPS